VLGGTQSLHTNSYDEALALPTEEAVRLALRTQQIIAHETGVTNTIDPLGGSWFVESMTNRMEEAAYDYFRKIEELGGMVEAVKRNFPQREIADASWRYQREVDDAQRRIVGVNRYAMDDEKPIEILKIDSALERKQLGRLQATRAARDSHAVERGLAELKEEAARPGRNMMFPLIECARLRCSEGEMIDALQEVFGSYRESPVF
jgi:methylmalonyl-CoA mutase N-terminal domain/subunit